VDPAKLVGDSGPDPRVLCRCATVSPRRGAMQNKAARAHVTNQRAATVPLASVSCLPGVIDAIGAEHVARDASSVGRVALGIAF